MTKKKIITLIACSILVSGIIGSGALISNKNMNVKNIQNHILLAAPDLDNLAVVINTNKNPLVLYSSPNSNSSVESYISVGEMLNYQSTSNPNFYKVTVQETGASGYISADNMQIVESGLNKTYSNINKNGQVINVTTNVKLMSSPDVHSQILGSYKENTPIIVIGKQDQWYKVKIAGQTGYMYQEYVGIDNSSDYTGVNIANTQISTNNKVSETDSKNIDNISNLVGKTVYTNPKLITFIQEAPSGSSNDIEVIKNKTIPLKILGVEKGINNSDIWYKVKNNNGSIGYINQSETYQKIISTTNKENVPVFAFNSTSSTIIMSTNYKATNFYVIKQVSENSGAMNNNNGNMYEVRMENGKVGYISVNLN